MTFTTRGQILHVQCLVHSQQLTDGFFPPLLSGTIMTPVVYEGAKSRVSGFFLTGGKKKKKNQGATLLNPWSRSHGQEVVGLQPTRVLSYVFIYLLF